MKKENKKLAQERRAKERQQEKQRKLFKKISHFGIAILIVALFFGFIYYTSRPETDDSTSEETTTEDTTTESDDTASTLNTDTSLTVEDGDTVNIDYVGTIDGVEFDGGNTNGSGADLEIGSGTYIDDFEEQLIGHNVGETVEVVVTFPEDYGNEDLNGKEAVFTTTINGIYE